MCFTVNTVSFDRAFHCILPYSFFSVCWAMLLTRWSFLFKVAKFFEKSLQKKYLNARQTHKKYLNSCLTKTMYTISKKNLTSGLNACRLKRWWVMVSSSPNMVCRLIIKTSKQQKRLNSMIIFVQLWDHLHCTVCVQIQRSNSGSRVSEMLCSHYNVFPGSSFETYLSWWLVWKGTFGKKQTETWHSAVGGS